MRLGVISDIHSEADRLDQALRLLQDCELIVCAGDISDQSKFDARAVQLLLECGVLAIKGNNDFAACRNPLIQKSTAGKPEERWLRSLADFPSHRYLTLGGLRLGVFHGSPWDDPTRDFFRYVFPESERDIQRIGSAGFDLVILGHTHRAMRLEANGTLIVNPGSCGCGNPPSCAVIDTGSRAVELLVLNR
ncbi:MAG: metallophosphoesterase family protein [Candidatus Binatia bacterium]